MPITDTPKLPDNPIFPIDDLVPDGPPSVTEHAILRTDKVKSIETRTGIVSVIIPDYADDFFLDNGSIVALGELIEYETRVSRGRYRREVYSIGNTEPGMTLEKLVIIGSPEMNDFSAENSISSHYNKPGSIVRGYTISKGDVFSVTAEMIPMGEPDVGKLVTTFGGYCLGVMREGDTFAPLGKIIDKEFYDNRWYYVIEVDDEATESQSGGDGDSLVGSAVVGTAIVG